MKAFTLALALLITACSAPTEQYRNTTPTTAPFITKGAVFTNQGNETTPVVFKGELLYVSDFVDTTGFRMRIFRQSTGEMILDNLTGLALISAIVYQDKLYVFGSANGNQEIDMISTTDLVNWTAPVKVYGDPRGLYNNSITVNADGFFVMAYEFGGGGYWVSDFLISGDLVHWTAIGQPYDPNFKVTACPTLRYVDGQYYMFFLSHYAGGTDGHGVYMTNIARSADLLTWQLSPTTVISPLDGGDVSNNASDMDLVELNGQVRIVYWNISQWAGTTIPNTGVREALFDGTLSQFVSKFF